MKPTILEDSVDTEGVFWKSVVRDILIPKRMLLLEELEAFNDDASKRDRSDFIRGRLFELNELINRGSRPANREES